MDNEELNNKNEYKHKIIQMYRQKNISVIV